MKIELTLQGKDHVAEVTMGVFSITRLVKNFKNNSATTFANGTRCFSGGFYRNLLYLINLDDQRI